MDAQDSLSPRNRARNFKSQFIEVYTGSQSFESTNLNVAIVILLQAADRVYEVILIDKNVTEEIGRFYVYEDELLREMSHRRDALSARAAAEDDTEEGPNTSTAPVKKKREKRISRSGDSESLSSLIQKKSNPTVIRRQSRSRVQEPPKVSRGNSVKGLESRSVRTQAPLDEASFRAPKRISLDPTDLADTCSLVRADTHHSEYSVATTTSATQQDPSRHAEIDGELLPLILCEDYTKKKIPTVRNPADYFSLLSGGAFTPAVGEHRKVDRTEVMRNGSLKRQDVSASAVKDITFFTAVILLSLFARHKARKDDRQEVQFVLFDVESNRFFTLFPDSLPPSAVDNCEATVLDPAATLAKMAYHETLTSDIREMSTVQHLVQTAGGLIDQTRNDLSSLEVEESRRWHADNVNPNTNRYRNMWQAAYKVVIEQNRRAREIRAEWAKILELHKGAKEQEAALAAHSKESKFRSLASGKNAKGAMSVEDISRYRSVLAHKRKQNGAK